MAREWRKLTLRPHVLEQSGRAGGRVSSGEGGLSPMGFLRTRVEFAWEWGTLGGCRIEEYLSQAEKIKLD